MMSNELLIQALWLGTAFSALLLGALAYSRAIKKQNYDFQANRAELEHIRKALESRLYELTDRLVDSEQRWRDVNHLLVSSIPKTPELGPTSSSVPMSNFLRAAGINEESAQVEPDLVFVLTPFHPDHEKTFDEIASVVRNTGLRCLRGDEDYIQGDILSHILSLIAKARIIIANIDGRNPNVFYELGIAHAMDKTTIVVSRGIEQLPFDMRTRKLIVYRELSDLREALQVELARVFSAEQGYRGPRALGSGAIANVNEDSGLRKVLIVGANPAVTARLMLDQEVREIRGSLARSDKDIAVEQSMATRFSDLRRILLKSTPDIVHFTGHGAPDGLVFEDSEGNSDLVGAKSLGQFFSVFGPELKCVVLNAAYSSRIAQEISKSVGTAIGMSSGISDRGSIAFSSAFYEALGAGRDVRFAFELARTSLQMEEPNSENKPEIFFAEVSKS